MKTAYIFHDAFSDPFSDWYPWMKTTLEGMGYLVMVPNFPTPGGQSYESWKAVLKNYINTFDEQTILIGHGTGGVLALRIAEELSREIHGLFLVASYAEKIGHEGYDRLNATFLDHTFAWDTIKSHAMVIKVYAGESDPFVPVATSKKLAESLGEELQTIPEGGHINKASGFIQATPIARGIKEAVSRIDRSIEPETVTPIVEPVSQPAVPAPQKTEAPLPASPEQISTPPKPEIHTMYEDMSHLVNSNRGSVASSLLAKGRQDEEEKIAKAPSSPRNTLYILGTLCMILVAVGIGVYLMSKYASVGQQARQASVRSLIMADTHQNISLTNKPSFILDKEIRTALELPQTPKTIRDIYYTNGSARASFTDLLSTLGTSTLPDELASEFSQPIFMHGVGSFDGGTQHFIIVPVTSYDTAFDQMKSWEQTMMRDVGLFMDVPSLFLKTKMTKDVFHDELINNKNVRVLRYHKPVDVTLDEPQPATTTVPTTDAAAATPATPAASDTPGTPAAVPQDLVFQGTQAVTSQNPLANVTAPYKENDIMLAYFFLNQHTVVITDQVNIIPELLSRYANSQIYGQ